MMKTTTMTTTTMKVVAAAAMVNGNCTHTNTLTHMLTAIAVGFGFSFRLVWISHEMVNIVDCVHCSEFSQMFFSLAVCGVCAHSLCVVCSATWVSRIR